MLGKEVYIFALWRSLIKCVTCGVFWPCEMGWFLFDHTIVVWASAKYWWEYWWPSWPGVSAQDCPFCPFFPPLFLSPDVCPPLPASGCVILLTSRHSADPGLATQTWRLPVSPGYCLFRRHCLSSSGLYCGFPTHRELLGGSAFIIFVSSLCPS